MGVMSQDNYQFGIIVKRTKEGRLFVMPMTSRQYVAQDKPCIIISLVIQLFRLYVLMSVVIYH